MLEFPLVNKKSIILINDYNDTFLSSQKLPSITFYCLINHFRSNILSVSFYTDNDKNKVHLITFKAKSAEVLCKLIGLHDKIIVSLSTSHALYIGMELMKAELTMITGQKYTQN